MGLNSLHVWIAVSVFTQFSDVPYKGRQVCKTAQDEYKLRLGLFELSIGKNQSSVLVEKVFI